MRIKLISFSESKFIATNVTHDVISEKIAEITGKEFEFLFCNTQNELFAGLKDGFENDDIILLAVDVSRFVSTKAALFRALGFKCRLNSKISDLINSDMCMATLNENQIKAHSAIPVGGEAFITNDGLFSGFGIKSGNQKLIFVPIDERRIGAVIENGFVDFLSEGIELLKEKEEAETETNVESDIPESMEGYVEPIEDFVSPAPVIEPEYEEIYKAPVEEEVEEQDDFEDVNSSSYGEEIETEEEAPSYEETLEQTEDKLSVLSERGVKVAFARVNGNTVLSNVLSGFENSSAAEFVDFPSVEATEDDKRKETVAVNAKSAMKQTRCDFAVAMSDIYIDANGEGYVFATLADVQKSSVFKIFSAEGETAEELYRSGMESVIEKIEELSQDMKPQMFEDDDEILPAAEAKKEISFATKLVIWLLIVVALCTLSALIIDTVMTSSDLSLSTSAIIGEMGNLISR